jgi:hypothetical protein
VARFGRLLPDDATKLFHLWLLPLMPHASVIKRQTDGVGNGNVPDRMLSARTVLPF